jgi:hypothetical protein
MSPDLWIIGTWLLRAICVAALVGVIVLCAWDMWEHGWSALDPDESERRRWEALKRAIDKDH